MPQNNGRRSRSAKEPVARRHPTLVSLVMSESGLTFRPEPPGDGGRLKLGIVEIPIDSQESEYDTLYAGLAGGALTQDDVRAVLGQMKSEYGVAYPQEFAQKLISSCRPADESDPFGDMEVSHHLESMSLVAVRIIDRAQKALLDVAPLSEIHLTFSVPAKIAVRLGWEAMAKQGRFPLPPRGARRLDKLREKPAGVMHFVSASDTDGGFIYTMGIALSPEAQALKSMDVSYGLDGELIVPGQAVSPIPPTLALSTRLFAASIPTSSNISEDIQGIPYSSFAHPEAMDESPLRGHMFRPKRGTETERKEEARSQLGEQLKSYRGFVDRTTPEEREFLPDVGAAIDVSDLGDDEIVPFVESVLEGFSPKDKAVTSLFLILTPSAEDTAATATKFVATPRYRKTCKIIDAAKRLGLKYVSICDQDEDEWMPNLLEYFTAAELNKLADYSDERGVIVCDGRPIDPVYTASTSAQRIQSVYTTLSVDILKMGMWLCLDALSARRVWRELQKNPHIPERMFLMPIGIVEPYSGFVDNRDRTKTPRAIIDPFEKIKFMIEEAAFLGAPSLLTDTRHKSRWVLLGGVDGDLKAHLRENEEFGATSLIGYKKFMECERLSREAGIILGQAGSIEGEQIFWIMSDTTYEAAMDGRNPATAIWTAETERVLRRSDGASLRGDLQSQRRAKIMPYLAVANRTNESHGKLDGWLRYLQTEGQGNEGLRKGLIAQRDRLIQMLDGVLDALAAHDSDDSPQRLGEYQQAWDAYSKEFTSYHAEIKQNFVPVRDQVATLWAAR